MVIVPDRDFAEAVMLSAQIMPPGRKAVFRSILQGVGFGIAVLSPFSKLVAYVITGGDPK